MGFKEKNWSSIIEDGLSEESYAVNRCFSEISLILEDQSVDVCQREALEKIQPRNRRFSRFPDCLSPFGYADPTYGDRLNLSKRYMENCKDPKFIYDYDDAGVLMRVENVGKALSFHVDCRDVDFYIGKDTRKWSIYRYITISARNRFSCDFLKISTIWNISHGLYLLDGYITRFWTTEEQNIEIINKYIFSDLCFPRFAKEPFHGARIRMEFIDNANGKTIKNTREVYPFMIWPLDPASPEFLANLQKSAIE